jgi:hypothetical protein
MQDTAALKQKINKLADIRAPLIVSGTSIAFAGCIVLCAINPQLLNNITLQSLTSSAFAVLAAALYLLYMIISRVVAIVLHHVETRHSAHILMQEYDEEPQETNRLTTEEDEEVSEQQEVPALSREAIIASMYLGGSGAFLAIPPLCMWDISISTSFALSLLVIAFLDASRAPKEFRSNVDTVKAIKNIRRLRFLHQTAILGLLLCVLWIDSQDRAFYFNFWAQHDNATMVDGQQWPLVLLAASSPFLLRGGPSRRHMTPSQTLETGLPICTLLAILVLCWYGPIETSLLTHFNSPLRTVIPMLVLCPPCIAAALAFVVHGLKTRSAGTAATLLSIALFIRQQTLPAHKMQHKIDWIALSSTLNLLLSALGYWLYRRHVVWTPEDKTIVDLQG